MWGAELELARSIEEPEERLIEIACRYFEFSKQHGPHFRLMFLETQSESDLKFVTPEGAQLIEDILRVYASYVAECFPCATDITQKSITLWAQSHGLVSLHLAGRLRFLPHDFTTFLRERVREYIRDSHLRQLGEKPRSSAD